MYSYIYDSFLQDKKYEKKIAQLENRVTDLGINGHIHRLSILKSLREIVQDEINNGTETIVVVGNDSTVSQIIDIVANQNITLAIIPIGHDNNIANALGITNENAIENLSKRISQKLDLGKANNIYFLFSLQIMNTNAVIENNGYKIIPRFDYYNIDIYNFMLENKKTFGDFSPKAFNPLDETLEAIIYKAGKESLLSRLLGKKRLDINTFLPFKKISIRRDVDKQEDQEKKGGVKTDQYGREIEEDNEIKVIIDGHKITKTPIDIEVVPKALKIIVGKDRVFANSI